MFINPFNDFVNNVLFVLFGGIYKYVNEFINFKNEFKNGMFFKLPSSTNISIKYSNRIYSDRVRFLVLELIGHLIN